MARTHSTRIDTKAGRAALLPKREPYWHKITSGRYIGARRLDDGSCTWIARLQIDRRKYYERLGDDRVRVVSNFDGLIFTIGDGPSTRMTAALAPRFLKGV